MLLAEGMNSALQSVTSRILDLRNVLYSYLSRTLQVGLIPCEGTVLFNPVLASLFFPICQLLSLVYIKHEEECLLCTLKWLPKLQVVFAIHLPVHSYIPHISFSTKLSEIKGLTSFLLGTYPLWLVTPDTGTSFIFIIANVHKKAHGCLLAAKEIKVCSKSRCANNEHVIGLRENKA